MGIVKTIIIAGMGINSHKETAHAAFLAGSDKVDIIHFKDLATGNIELAEYKFLIFPGGFMDGDDLGAAQVAALRWKYLKNNLHIPLLSLLKNFISNGGIILGICNGFQLLVKLGLLPGFEPNTFVRFVSLANNFSVKFENRWVNLTVNPQSNCIFTKNLSNLKLPIRHGEGRLVCAPDVLKKISQENLNVLSYANSSYQVARDYPDNPNGSLLNIAGLSDPTGRIFGLMPHPEAFHHYSNHPSWTRGMKDAPGTLIFVNAINYLRNSA